VGSGNGFNLKGTRNNFLGLRPDLIYCSCVPQLPYKDGLNCGLVLLCQLTSGGFSSMLGGFQYDYQDKSTGDIGEVP
jgi:hypothetical protein